MDTQNSSASKPTRKRPGVTNLYVDLTPELKERLLKKAKEEDRTLRSVVERLLRKALK